MKYLLAITILVGSFASTSPSFAGNAHPGPATASSNTSGTILRSRAQLNAYLEANAQSPLYKLGASKMKTFLRSLVFTAKGVGSYSFVELEGMPVTDVRDILALFGLQDDASIGRSLSPIAQAAGGVSRSRSKRSPPRWGQTCIVSPGGRARPHCKSADGYRCSSVCR